MLLGILDGEHVNITSHLKRKLEHPLHLPGPKKWCVIHLYAAMYMMRVCVCGISLALSLQGMFMLLDLEEI